MKPTSITRSLFTVLLAACCVAAGTATAGAQDFRFTVTTQPGLHDGFSLGQALTLKETDGYTFNASVSSNLLYLMVGTHQRLPIISVTLRSGNVPLTSQLNQWIPFTTLWNMQTRPPSHRILSTPTGAVQTWVRDGNANGQELGRYRITALDLLPNGVPRKIALIVEQQYCSYSYCRPGTINVIAELAQSCNAELQQLRSTLPQRQSVEQTLIGRKSAQSQEQTNLLNEANSLDDKIKTLNSKFAACNPTVSNLRSQKAALEQQRNDLRAQINSLTPEVTNLAAQFKNLNTHSGNLQAHGDNLTRALNETAWITNSLRVLCEITRVARGTIPGSLHGYYDKCKTFGYR